MRILYLVIFVLPILPASLSGQEAIETIEKPLSLSGYKFDQKEALSLLVESSNDVVFSVEAEQNASFQIYNEKEHIIIEILLTSYKVRDTEPFYFQLNVKCPEGISAKVDRERPISTKSEAIDAFIQANSINTRAGCTVLLDENNKIQSWTKAYVLELEKDFDALERLLNNLSTEIFSTKANKSFIFKQIILP